MPIFSRYLGNYKRYLVLGPLFKLMEAIFELIVPLVMADIIDNGINGADASVGYVLGRGGILAALAVAGLGFALVCQYFASKCSQGFGTDLRNDLFSRLTMLSESDLRPIGAASAVTRLTSDINQMQTAVAMMIRLVIRAPFLVVGSIVMAFIVNARLALIFLAVAPLVSLCLYFIMKASVPRYGKVQRRLDRVTQIARENLSGARVVRAFSQEEAEEKRFAAEADALAAQSVAVGKISALLNPVNAVVVNAAVVAVLWLGGLQIDAGSVTQGELVAFVNYMTQISLALVVVANLVVLFTKTAASAKRVEQALALEPAVKDTATREVVASAEAPAVEFDRVSFGYGGGYVLTDISFSVRAGQRVGIIGGTGSGKSSLVNLIARLADVSAGAVRVEGADVRDYPIARLRRIVGVVPQKASLFSGTVRSNLLWGKEDATEEELRRALRVAEAENVVAETADGLDAPVLQNGKNFSGGQRQRLTIARALVGDPRILILDDSASALDLATDRRLRRNLAELKDTAVFIVSQRASAVRFADFIVVLDGGRAAGIGTHDELLKSCPVYREIVRSQTEAAR